jgi:hypothetical protein
MPRAPTGDCQLTRTNVRDAGNDRRDGVPVEAKRSCYWSGPLSTDSRGNLGENRIVRIGTWNLCHTC